jgi:poly(3-hydroxybutyrate) depolymerase
MSGEDMKTLTSWTEIADEEGIVVVFPDGGGFAPWNVGEKTVCSAGEVVNDTTQDDFGFVENMIENIDQAVCVDRTKVFVTGFSMGGYFTNNIACHRPNLVRAVAPHSGGMEIDLLTMMNVLYLLAINGQSSTAVQPKSTQRKLRAVSANAIAIALLTLRSRYVASRAWATVGPARIMRFTAAEANTRTRRGSFGGSSKSKWRIE